MKIVFAMLALLAVAACVAPGAKEAKCACFTSTGEPTGNCDFQAVSGAPATFSFADTGAGPC